MFTLTTDTSVDIFRNELDAMNVPFVPLSYTIDGKTYEDRFTTDDEFESFYALLAEGKLPSTSQINPARHEEFFERVYGDYKSDIVHLSLSSGLSKTYESACFAANRFMEKHPTVKVHIVDTLAATSAMRPVLEKALLLRDEGADGSVAADTLRAYTLRLQAYIIADDLFHLKRGGRISAAAAAVGTVFNVKPVIVFTEKGKLEVYKKTVGFNKALKTVLEHIEQFCPNAGEKKIWIANANAHQKAALAKKAIEEKFGSKVQIDWIGPVIGSHTGGGTVGIVFEANSRLM